jgi:hypothetical protein
MKEIENRKRKRRKEEKNRKGAEGQRFGPEQKSAHGPTSLTQSGIPFSSLPSLTAGLTGQATSSSPTSGKISAVTEFETAQSSPS